MIDDLYRDLGGQAGMLGAQTSGELACADGVGRKRHYVGGSIFWKPGQPAHEVHGDINERYQGVGAERSPLGYPVANEEAGPPGVRVSRFENGYISWTPHDSPLTFYCQNMALLGSDLADALLLNTVVGYKGTDRDGCIRAVIEYISSTLPDIVGLSEVFLDDEREAIYDSLRATHPYRHQGPAEADLDEDGGLLLLSRHKILIEDSTIYRATRNRDDRSDKGALYIRVQPAGHPTPCDIFLSHLQNPNEGAFLGLGPSNSLDVVERQLTALGEFMAGNRTEYYPAFLLGDLNTDARDPDRYSDMMWRLAPADPPSSVATMTHVVRRYLPEGLRDLFRHAGGVRPAGLPDHVPFHGITLDHRESFNADKPELAADDGGRHQEGNRIDYILYWPAPSLKVLFSPMEVVIIGSSEVRQVSDHYGLRINQGHVCTLDTHLDRPPSIASVTVELEGFFCNNTTDGAGWDDILMRVDVLPSGHATQTWRQSGEIHITAAEGYDYDPFSSLTVDNPRDLTIKVSAIEVDTSGDDHLGPSVVNLSAEQLAWRLGGQRRRIFMPIMRRSGAQYSLKVFLTVL